MKNLTKTLLTSATLMLLFLNVKAQDWKGPGVTSAGGNIYYDDGNVGIGTSTPGATLTIKQPGGGYLHGLKLEYDAISYATIWQSGTHTFLRNSSSGSFYFKNSSGTALNIAGSGNIGIGVLYPSHKLDVDGSIRAKTLEVHSNMDEPKGIKIVDENDEDNYFEMYYDPQGERGEISDGVIFRNTENVPWVFEGTGGIATEEEGSSQAWYQGYQERGSRIAGSGLTWNTTTKKLDVESNFMASNVGIGTTTPAETLHVAGTGQFDDMLKVQSIEFEDGSTLTSGESSSLNIATTTDANTGIISQNGSSLIHTYGIYNTNLGENAGNFTTTGQFNVAVGTSVLTANTTGTHNTGIGYATLVKNTTGNYNLGVGTNALKENTAGSSNTSFGVNTLTFNTTGNTNTGLGTNALQLNTTGSNNVAIGNAAGRSNSTGNGNVFIGFKAGKSATGSDKLYIENSAATTPLIYGDFASDEVGINTNNTTGYTLSVGGNAQIDSTLKVQSIKFEDGSTLTTGRSLWSGNNDNIKFATGNVSIGTHNSSSLYRLHVSGQVKVSEGEFSVFSTTQNPRGIGVRNVDEPDDGFQILYDPEGHRSEIQEGIVFYNYNDEDGPMDWVFDDGGLITRNHGSSYEWNRANLERGSVIAGSGLNWNHSTKKLDIALDELKLYSYEDEPKGFKIVNEEDETDYFEIIYDAADQQSDHGPGVLFTSTTQENWIFGGDGEIVSEHGSSSQWNTGYKERGSVIAGSGLIWDDNTKKLGIDPDFEILWEQSGTDATFGSGRVGVGTASPDAHFHVQNGSTGYSWDPIAGTVGIFESNYANRSFITIAGKSNAQSELWFGDEQRQNSGRLRYEHDNDAMEFWTSGTNQMTINRYGRVGIGTTTPDELLTVKGVIHAERVKVDLTVPGPDYVFEEDYNLRSLENTAQFIKENKHLPEVPSAKEMEANGVDVGEMNMLLLKKIEELTLHVLDLKKENDSQNEVIELLKTQIDSSNE